MTTAKRPRRLTFAILATAMWVAATAGCSVRSQVASLMHDSWQVLKEYERDGYTYYVVREGARYTKIVQLPSGPVYTVYEVDTLTRHCKWGDVLIRCESLRAEPDMAGFLTWLRPLPPMPLPPLPAPAAPAPQSAPQQAPPPAPTPSPAAEPTEANPYETPPTPSVKSPWD